MTDDPHAEHKSVVTSKGVAMVYFHQHPLAPPDSLYVYQKSYVVVAPPGTDWDEHEEEIKRLIEKF